MQAFNLFLTATVHVAFAHVFRPTRYGDGDATAAAMRAKASAMLEECFAMIDRKLSDGRPFVHGDHYTVSDPYLLVFSRWLDRADLGPVDKFPLVAAHRRRIEARPAVQKVLAAEG
jgi:glutathione S-transferase